MTLTSNQFEQDVVVGSVDTKLGTAVALPCEVSSSEAGTLLAGDKVKIEDSAGGVPKVLKIDADTDVSFGVIGRNFINNNWVAGDAVEVSIDGTVIWQEAGAAIARGANVEAVSASGKVITSAGTNPILGKTLDKASADGDLVRVLLTSIAKN